MVYFQVWTRIYLSYVTQKLLQCCSFWPCIGYGILLPTSLFLLFLNQNLPILCSTEAPPSSYNNGEWQCLLGENHILKFVSSNLPEAFFSSPHTPSPPCSKTGKTRRGEKLKLFCMTTDDVVRDWRSTVILLVDFMRNYELKTAQISFWLSESRWFIWRQQSGSEVECEGGNSGDPVPSLICFLLSLPRPLESEWER